jgi:tetratricopeptide (TPR) repeat protein
MKRQAPKPKSQRSTNHQGSLAGNAAFGIWCFIGIWCLGFGACGCRSSKPPPEPPVAVARAERSTAQAQGLSEQQNWPAAASEWSKAAKEASLLNDGPGEATALHNLADAERQLQQFDSAVSNALAAAEINEGLARKEDWWRNQILLLQVEDLQTNRSPGKRLERLTPRIAESTDPNTRGAFWNELGLWKQREGKLDEAAETLQRAQSEYARGNDAAGVATVIANRAKLFEAQGRPDLAALAWADALRRFEVLGEPVAIAHALLGQGRALIAANKDLPKADMHLRRAARNFRHLRLFDEAAEADEMLRRLHAGQ